MSDQVKRPKGDSQTDVPSPRIFISYSYDSPGHRKWVGELASKLVENGIDVIFDQWDLGLGDDIPKFMEKSVYEAERVLMICTETYVRKADDGKGGVGYETMIVTGELVKDLGTSKFIPVIRQQGGGKRLPKSVSTRRYVNLSEGENSSEQFEELLRELHRVPALPKPRLGKSPFGKEPEHKRKLSTEIVDLSRDNKGISDIYISAIDIARKGDIVLWRRIIREAKRPIPTRLGSWRAEYEASPPNTKEKLSDMLEKGAAIYAPLMALALAGVESSEEKFNNQIAIIDEILEPRNWNRSGPVVVVDLPSSVAFVYQALHGAMCIQTEQIPLAINLVRTRITPSYTSESAPLYTMREIMGWPASLGGNCVVGWKFLMELHDMWPWLQELYGQKEELQSLFCAYYMALNILELADTIATGHEQSISHESLNLDIPTCFPSAGYEVARKGYRHLLNNPNGVRSIWECFTVSEAKMKELWPAWITHVASFCSSLSNLGFRMEIPHKNLFSDLV